MRGRPSSSCVVCAVVDQPRASSSAIMRPSVGCLRLRFLPEEEEEAGFSAVRYLEAR